MKKLFILGLVLLMVVVFATIVFGKAEKSDLLHNVSGTVTPNPDGDIGGFVILNNPDPEEEDDECNLVVVVSLKDGVPNSFYNIYLEYWIDTSRLHVYILGGISGTVDSGNDPLHTNENGKGNFELRLKTQDLECLWHHDTDFPSGPCKLQIVAGTTLASAYTQFVSTAVDITIK
jgi:hypothetical protein